MEKTLHDMRNDLAVAVASLEAFIDGKLEPNVKNFTDVLESLNDLDRLTKTLREQARRWTLPATEDLFTLVVEAAPSAMIVSDEAGRMQLVNAQTERLFGFSRQELLGQSIEMLVPERFRRSHSALRARFDESAVARPMGAGRDLFGRRADGSEVPIEIGLNPIVVGGQRGTLVAITDITERKRAEELRLAHAGVQQHAAELEEFNRELAAASRFKTQFVATMSHELRTPLTAIIGAAELLSKAKLSEREALSVQTIDEAAEALFSLINSILDFSKIEAGKIDLQSSVFSVESVLESAADVVAQLAREKNLTLHAYVDPAIPRVCGDADRLRQILLNLLGNAVKFTERGHVVARVVPLHLATDDVVLRFEVQDTGVGMEPDLLPQLFEPFAQAGGSTARRFGGTGLGLSISKRLVELMGGKIGVESEPTVGSLFWFTIRFKAAGEARAVPPRALEGVGGLILTGDDTFAQIIERYMESWSMQSRRALNRDDVVQSLQSGNGRTWVAVVDLDDLGITDVGVTLDVLRAIVPARVIAVGKNGPLHKPVRQSHLFDAIVKRVETQPPPARPTAQTRPASDEPLETGPILVAEDNVRLSRLLGLQFEELGVRVTFVADGRQAVDALAHDRYAMVFMDCQMPVLDGLSATKLIRERERGTGTHVPIAAMTANAFAEDREACLAAGMDDYLAKPVKLADLRRMLERWATTGLPATAD